MGAFLLAQNARIDFRFVTEEPYGSRLGLDPTKTLGYDRLLVLPVYGLKKDWPAWMRDFSTPSNFSGSSWGTRGLFLSTRKPKTNSLKG
jgi:hypothetical protein